MRRVNHAQLFHKRVPEVLVEARTNPAPAVGTVDKILSGILLQNPGYKRPDAGPDRDHTILPGFCFLTALHCPGFQVDVLWTHVEQLHEPPSSENVDQHNLNTRIRATIPQLFSFLWGKWLPVGVRDIKIPHIKLPHFKVTGKNSYGLPSFGIDWYAKAMNSGIRLDGATIFGAANGNLLAGGEAGPEWIVGERSLVGMIRSAIRSEAAGGNTVTIGDTNIIINADGQDAEEIANRVDEIITMRLHQAEAAWA